MSAHGASVSPVSRLKPLLNLSEAAVDRDLRRYADDHGYGLTIKTRLRDVLQDDPAWTQRERDFAFMAHLDFVAFDVRSGEAILAVEYDGPQHLTDPRQRERDLTKERLCAAAGLPLLRIDSQFARKEGRWRVLGYILEMHEVGKAFTAAQSQGLVPEDEVFIHNLIIDTTDPKRPSFTGLDTVALGRLQSLVQKGGMRWFAQWWRGSDSTTEAQCALALANGQFLASSCALRHFAIEGISSLAVADELAMAELGWLIHRYEAGEAVALSPDQGVRLLADLHPSNGWNISAGINPPDQ